MKLFEPFRIGTMEVKNRVVMAPMGTGYANHDGTVSQRLVDYYVRRAKGGVGMIVLEHHMVHPTATGVGPELRIDDDRFIAGQAWLVREVHAYGCRIGAQLNHPGRQTTLGTPIGPSPISIEKKGAVPRELTEDEIQDLIDSYVESARRIRDAGHDFVEIHAAHGYLACSFLSPFSNQRTDKWGGSTENRTRFVTEIARRIRARLGPDFPITCRISGSEFVDGGLTAEEGARIAPFLQSAGVNAISVSAGNWQSLHHIMMPMFMPVGELVPIAAAIKQSVSIPVIVAGRLNDPELAEQVVASGKADAIAIGRGLIADPDWPRKVQEGQAHRVRPCIACNCCVDRVSLEQDAWCSVNAACGFERQFAQPPALLSRHVVVVGGGPAGFVAAETARIRGHRVTLVEKDTTLGGKVNIASVPPGKDVMAEFSGYMAGELQEIGVEFMLGTAATPQLLRDLKPDMVVIATGSQPVVPPLPGLDQVHWETADAVLGGASVGRRVVVVGGSATGCETAEVLLERGHPVALIEMIDKLGAGMEQITRRFVYHKLKRAGANINVNTRVTGFSPGQVAFVNQVNGEAGTIPVDTVVLALGYRPDNRMVLALKDDPLDCETLIVGDASKPGNIAEAVRNAADRLLSI